MSWQKTEGVEVLQKKIGGGGGGGGGFFIFVDFVCPKDSQNTCKICLKSASLMWFI